ncbi:MAG TPA: hypothetical protein VKC57_01680, partial [Ktedonobacterales bacterium]|nr:hypothetical protein [Ktedonobacterales bacterium]
RLLAYCPEDTLSDGGAWAASQGLFGYDDEPPWDSWIEYVVVEDRSPKTYLLSGVPSRLMDIAASGIEAAIGASLHWVAEMDAPFARALRDADLAV